MFVQHMCGLYGNSFPFFSVSFAVILFVSYSDQIWAWPAMIDRNVVWKKACIGELGHVFQFIQKLVSRVSVLVSVTKAGV